MSRDRALILGAVGAAVVVTILSVEVLGDAGSSPPTPASTSVPDPWTTSTPPPPATTTRAPTTTGTEHTPASSATTTTSVAEFSSSIAPVHADDLSHSWREGCPVAPEDLRAVTVSHWGFDGAPGSGTLIVAASVAEDVVAIMASLYAERFPIERMEPVEVYDGDDDRSMAANNTSAFNCRPVTGGSSWSEHSYGTAIDVNPLVNPYVREDTVLPPQGARYSDRSLDAPGMIHAGDEVVNAFASRGWVWGGTWSSPKDYQHFSTSGH
jgi:hypothetical protein